jgi:radical SAM protein with 4Fe4S-binding SPASM domain
MHDMFRVYPDGSGTYDDAIAGYLCARDIIGNNKCNVKMTPCRANIDELPKGVIELFELGLRYIQCAVVLEDRWEEEEEDYVYSLMLPIMDYLLENKRYKTKTFAPIRPRMAFMRKMDSSPNCSACKGGTACLSFNGKIYGCHHFCTLDVPADYGAVDLENNRIVIYNEPLIYKLLNTWRSRSEKCLNCELGVHCVACSAAMYECNPENLGEFHEKYTQCGWTKGVFKARMEFKDRIAQAETSQDE